MKAFPPLNDEQRELVESSMSFVRWTVQRFIHTNESIVGLEYDDLCQEGAIALCRAAATYTPGRAAFKTYAITLIRNHLISYCRGVMADYRNLPTVSAEDDADMPAAAEIAAEDARENEETRLSRICTREILARRKAEYHGCVKLGIEALELKVLDGYGVTDIAQLYNAKPKLVGAWISKATKKLREDMTAEELEAVGIENLPASA